MTDQKLPQNTAELLAVIDREWTSLMHMIDKLTPEQMATPDPGGWSPKDNLAHLAHWERFMRFRYLENQPAHEAMGFDAKTLTRLDEDGINAQVFEWNQNRSTTDVLSELKRMHAEVMATLKQKPFSELMKPVSEDDPEKRPVILWVLGNTSEHFDEHRKNIEKAVRPKA